MQDALTGDGAAAVTQAVSGLGGVGKTSLVTEFAYRAAGNYSHVLWVRADSVASLESAFVMLARELDLPGKDAEKTADVIAAARRWLTANHGYLLILDNADFDDRYKPDHLLAFLPNPRPPRLILTTRTAPGMIAGKLGVRKRLELETWPPPDAIRYLTERVHGEGATITGDEGEAAAELAEELGYLPLALEQAASYIAERQQAFGTYLALFRKQSIALLEKHSPETEPYERTVATTWTISLDAVSRESPAAAELLAFCAFLAPDAIPAEIILYGRECIGPTVAEHFARCGAEEAEWEAAYDDLLLPLLRYSLVEKESAVRTFLVHRLVQEVVRTSLDEAGQRQGEERAINALHAAFPSPDYANWDRCERLLVQARAVSTAIYSTGAVLVTAGRLLNEIGFYLEERGQYTEAEPLFKEALIIYRQTLPAGHPWIVTSLNNLAESYRLQRRFADAEPLYKEALAIRQDSGATDHPFIAVILNNLALLYESQGRIAEAEQLHHQILTLRKAALPVGHPAIAYSLNNLATLYKEQGRFAEAEPLFKEALTINRQCLPAWHPAIAISLSNLAGLYKMQGRLSDAEPLYEEAVPLMVAALGEAHPDTKIVIGNYRLFLAEKAARGEG